MDGKDDLKKKILKELSNETEGDVVLQSILKEETQDILGQEFTRSVVKAAKAAKKVSPVIRLTRVALPFAACAAALLIFVSVGLRDNENSPLPKDFDTIKIEGNTAVMEDPYKSNSDDSDTAPSEEQDEKIPAASKADVEETAGDPGSNNTPPASSGSSRYESEDATDAYSGENTYSMNVASLQISATPFTSSDNSKQTNGEIILKVSDTYRGKAIFGYELYLSVDGEEYEVIVTSGKEISKSELLSQIESYTTNLCNLMNKAENTDEWQIVIVTENLPSTIEPNTRIRMKRTK